MNAHPVAAYLADCRARHKTGAVTPETSYYGPLETLLNAVGQKLKKPRVRCFMSLQNQAGNDRAYWKNVPRPVWEYTLGGYQVMKKWLSYREQTLLGRPLTVEEVTYFRDVIRRIAALLLLGPTLDANYAATKANTHPWPEGKG